MQQDLSYNQKTVTIKKQLSSKNSYHQIKLINSEKQPSVKAGGCFCVIVYSFHLYSFSLVFFFTFRITVPKPEQNMQKVSFRSETGTKIIIQ